MDNYFFDYRDPYEWSYTTYEELSTLAKIKT